jgi:hypothetical protein
MMGMKTRIFTTAAAFLMAFATNRHCCPLTLADDPDLRTQLRAAKDRVPQNDFDLRYKFREGEVIRSEVVHMATTETKIQGNTQTSKSRSTSVKLWRVVDVAENGNISFVHSVESVDMWQKLSDRPEVRYNSTKDKKPPPVYEAAAKTVGIPLAEITIDPRGNVIERESKFRKMNIGMGDITTPLPAERAKVGHVWTVPNEITVRMPDDQVKRIKTRQKYTLEKVQTGVATIRLQTQVLTPVRSPEVKSQLIQQLNDGTIRFDIDAGRVISKQMDWDETVIGFNGADSLMEYLARFTETLLPPSDADHADSAVEPAVSARPKPIAGPAPLQLRR